MNLIKQSACKRYLLDTAAKTRSHKFTRVSRESLELMESRLISCMDDWIRSLPSKGKTI